MSVEMSVGKALSILRSAIVNARIYPKGSQMIESSLKNAYQALSTCLDDCPQIIVSDIQGKLCVNGKEVADARDFRPFLVQYDVQSIKLSKGLEASEVSQLVEALGMRKGLFGDKKNLTEWFQSQGAKHVQFEEIRFVAVQKGEVVVQQVLGLLEQSAGDVTSMGSALEESFHLIGQLPDESAKKQVQQQLAEHLAKAPPYQLREFLECKLPEGAEKSGLRDQVIQTLSRDKLEETLEEVNKWYRKIKEESQSELEVVEKLNSLKSFLGKVLHSPASKSVSFALYEELLNIGVLEEIPPGVQKGERSSLMAQVEQLLDSPSAQLLDPPVRQRFPELLKALCAMGMDEPLQKLTDKVMENLRNPAPLVRETAVRTLRDFEEIFATNRKEKPFLALVNSLHEMAEVESAPDVYGEVAQALQVAAMELLVNWRFEESASLLATLRRHSRDESPIGQKKKQLAAKSLHDFSVRGFDVICADLNAPLKDRQTGSYRVLAELGESAVEPLIEALRRSVDPRARQAVIQAMKRLGPVVKEPLLRQIHIGVAGDILVKLVPLLEDLVDLTMLPTLSNLLQHPDAAVRREVAALLVQVKDPRVQGVLMSLLDDIDPEIQAEAVRSISELRLSGAVVELTNRLLSSPPIVQEELCIALGTLGERSAVPSLVKLLQAKGSFWRKSARTTDTVRIRAAWALGQLLPDADAEKALGRALKDPNAMVRRSAENALNRRSAAAA
jgi:HEAT repeat protein